MKKFAVIMLSSIIVLFLVAGSVSGQDVIRLRWYQPEPPGHPWTDVGQMIADEIFERSDGRIHIRQYPAGQLGSQYDAVEQLRTGSLDFLTSGPTILVDFDPDVQVFALPYLFRDKDHAYAVFESPTIQELFNERILEKSGVRTIQFWYFGNRTLTISGKEVETPGDLDGVRIRSMDAPVFLEVIKGLGADPTPIAFTELYMALQTGVVQGQENPVPTIYSQKFYEVQDYIVLTNHSVHMGTVHVSEQMWQSLSEEDREMILEVFEEYRPEIDERILKDTEEKLELMKEEGIEIIEPDLEAFREHAFEHIMDVYGDRWGDLIREIQAVE
jgi:TRAP-type transport system periplasmic protein